MNKTFFSQFVIFNLLSFLLKNIITLLKINFNTKKLIDRVKNIGANKFNQIFN